MVEFKMVVKMGSVNNRGRSKFFPCFKPVVNDDEPCSHTASPPPSDEENGGGRITAHCSLSNSLKAVFLRTPLVKRLRSKRCRRSSSSNASHKTKKKSLRNGFSDQNEILEHNSDRSSLFSSSASSSSRASSVSSSNYSSTEPERINEPDSLEHLKLAISTDKMQQAMKRLGSKCNNYNSAVGMCVLVICLVALIFWGKAFAIVTCTSTWLFLAPASRRCEGGGSTVDNVDSEEYKKRVIMEGLLGRNRARVV